MAFGRLSRKSASNKGSDLWQRLRKQKTALWSIRCLYVLLFVALFADFIANEKPLYCKIDGETYFPVFKNYAVHFAGAKWDKPFLRGGWTSLPYESVVFPPIPYSASTQDVANRGLVGPFDQQRIASLRWRHWLGTDQLGRDVAAGLIAGTRTAMLVGVIAMSIATIIGVFLGAIAGYFADDRFKISIVTFVLVLLAIFPAIFFGFIARTHQLNLADREGNSGGEILIGIAIAAGILGLAGILGYFIQKILPFGKKIILPLDLVVMRLIEIFRSVPALLLLLAIAAILEKPSILYVMAIIGLIRWTGIAQFLRAEILKIRNLEYIEAGRALGFSNGRIIFRHALPNALTPVLITIAFGVAGAILLEAFMSFLGIGVAAEDVTWGGLLNLARQNFSAWWLAVFPGLAIFITVTIFNLIGEGLTNALDVRQTML